MPPIGVTIKMNRKIKVGKLRKNIPKKLSPLTKARRTSRSPYANFKNDFNKRSIFERGFDKVHFWRHGETCDLHFHLSELNKLRVFHIVKFLAWGEFAILWVKLQCKWLTLVVPIIWLRMDLSNWHWVSLLISTHWGSERESPSWAQKGNWASQHCYCCCWDSKDSLGSSSGSWFQVANVHLASLVNFTCVSG